MHGRGHAVTSSQVVLCTNGFVDHVVTDQFGAPIGALGRPASDRPSRLHDGVRRRAAAPAAMSYIRNPTIGGDTAYVYVTRRTYDRPDDTVTLTCMGGPEYPFHETPTTRILHSRERCSTPWTNRSGPSLSRARPPGLPYDFQWHGLMGYNDGGIRVVGAHPRHPRLLYNLGCNGVGFLPSIYGGKRIGAPAGRRAPEPEHLRPSLRPCPRRYGDGPLGDRSTLTAKKPHVTGPLTSLTFGPTSPGRVLAREWPGMAGSGSGRTPTRVSPPANSGGF